MSTTGLRTGTRMSLDEFLALGETDGKWELDDGVLYIMAPGTPDHQYLGLEFSRRILDYLDSFEQPPAHLYQEMTTLLSRTLQRAPEPDIVIILDERRGIVGSSRVEAPPDIVVVILSTDRNRDLVRKRQIYAEAGVLEYWNMRPGQRHCHPTGITGTENTSIGRFSAPTTPLPLRCCRAWPSPSPTFSTTADALLAKTSWSSHGFHRWR